MIAGVPPTTTNVEPPKKACWFREHLKSKCPLRQPKSSKQQQTTIEQVRRPGESPCDEDLNSVVFSPIHTFQLGEVVMVTRSRGGFAYAVITESKDVGRCYLDTSVAHESKRYRTEYKCGSGQPMFKELPAHYIGKLAAASATTTVTKQQQANELMMPVAMLKSARAVGNKVVMRDLQSVVFLPTATFTEGQLVAVPRSSGGFSYGRVLQPHMSKCCSGGVELAHDVAGWRVVVKEETKEAPKIFKDVPSGVIGRVLVIDEAPTPGHALLAPRPLTIKRHQPSTSADAPSCSSSSVGEISSVCGAAGDEELEEETILFQGTTLEENTVVDEEDDDGDELLLEATRQTGSDSDDEHSAPQQQQQQAPQPQPIVKAPSPKQQAAAEQPLPPPPQQPVASNGGLFILPPGVASSSVTPCKKTGMIAGLSQIVIDAPNVATRHGQKNCLSISGLRAAIAYYVSRGHEVIAFLPEHFFTRKPQAQAMGGLKLSDFMAVVDDHKGLEKLVAQKLVVLTPPQDYDDSYAIKYAKLHDACIVTNDRYKDHLEKYPARDKVELRKWLYSHVISFTFVRDEFMPNPDFKFPQPTTKPPPGSS